MVAADGEEEENRNTAWICGIGRRLVFRASTPAALECGQLHAMKVMS
jgi:hypothetical protein